MRDSKPPLTDSLSELKDKLNRADQKKGLLIKMMKLTIEFIQNK